MDCHVTAVSKAAFCSIRNIGRIRQHLTRNAAETIIHAFVTSRLDSNNSLLYIWNYNITTLSPSTIAEYSRRIITYTKRTDHITPVLADLHWLPIEQRLKYKICLLLVSRSYMMQLLLI